MSSASLIDVDAVHVRLDEIGHKTFDDFIKLSLDGVPVPEM